MRMIETSSYLYVSHVVTVFVAAALPHSSLSKMAHWQISPIHVPLLILILAFTFVKIYIVLSALSNVDVFTRNMICGN